MTPAHIELIKNTIPVLRENGVTLTQYFYQRMLNGHPELKNTFNLDHQSSGMQPRALAAAVLAYAENIENPAVLAKAVERITTKHVSLNIQPEQYDIVGEHLLHSISEVLDVPMESELIAAWAAAYTQLAELLIGVEKAKYESLTAQNGGWAGWRTFVVQTIDGDTQSKIIRLVPQDQAAVITAQSEDFISVRVELSQHGLRQPQQFKVLSSTTEHYDIQVNAEKSPSEYSVIQALLGQIQVGDIVEVSAPMKL